MRKRLFILVLGIAFVFPNVVFAQSNIALTNVSVQLWPEYDQPSMLVITDFEVAADTPLPVDLTFRIPGDANLIAVANYTADGGLANANIQAPRDDGEWQVFTMTLESNVARFEYYQLLSYNGDQRLFSYLWDGAYAVDSFNIRVLEPLDAASLITNPALTTVSQEGDLTYYAGEPVKLGLGGQFTLTLEYQKSTNTLIANPQGVEPASPVDADTTGRVSLSNYVPYIIGGLGLIMIVGGVVYYWQSGRKPSGKSRRRAHAHAENEEDATGPYCPQCGARAKLGDRFCRTCGARLRHQEE
jgi:hypothetical protein